MARPTGKRGTFTFRTTPSLREQLQAAADRAERPVSEEIEARLQRSFEQDADRQIIREEIRAALDIKDARAIGSSIGSAAERHGFASQRDDYVMGDVKLSGRTIGEPSQADNALMFEGLWGRKSA